MNNIFAICAVFLAIGLCQGLAMSANAARALVPVRVKALSRRRNMR